MINVLIASIPDREKTLYHTVFSLIDQVDCIHVVLNNYTHNPFDFMAKNRDKVKVYFSDNSLGDASRYIPLKGLEDTYILTCDDDLVYPRHYAEDTIKRMVDSNYKIVSYHGRSFDNFPLKSYYNDKCIKYRCLDSMFKDDVVQFAGTGVMAFHTKDFKPSIDIFKRSNMSDIWIGIEAKKKGINIDCLSHDKDYFRYQQVKDTIWDNKHNNDVIETEIVNNNF